MLEELTGWTLGDEAALELPAPVEEPARRRPELDLFEARRTDLDRRAAVASTATRPRVTSFAEAAVGDDVRGPKRGRRVPRVLSLAEVESILECPDPSTPIGLRAKTSLAKNASRARRSAKLSVWNSSRLPSGSS